MNHKNFKNRKLISLILINMALINIIFGYFGILKPESIELGQWFESSGFIVVVCAILSEINIYTTFRTMKPELFDDEGGPSALDGEIILNIMRYFGAVVLILGGVISGYGSKLV